MSMVGGMFAGIAPLATSIVVFFNGGSFATYIIQNLFLARKEPPDFSRGESQNIVAAHSSNEYRALKRHTKRGFIR
jgi:hypothetical protein